MLFLFLSWHIESMLYLRWKAFSIVIKFLVLWSINLSSSLAHFKNGSEYIITETVQVFIPLMRSKLLVKCFFIFSFISTYLMVSLSNLPKYLEFPFSPSFFIVSWFCSSIPYVPTFHYEHCSFSVPNFIPIFGMSILIVCIRISSSLLFLIQVCGTRL